MSTYTASTIYSQQQMQHYQNIQAGPPTAPAQKYCDITGLPTTYRDPVSRLHYASKEVYDYIQRLTPHVRNSYLELRGEHIGLK